MIARSLPMKSKLIIPYIECVELAHLKLKKDRDGYKNFSRSEKARWEMLCTKEKGAKEIGRAWIEELTGVTVWTRPTLGYLIKKLLGFKIQDNVRWR